MVRATPSPRQIFREESMKPALCWAKVVTKYPVLFFALFALLWFALAFAGVSSLKINSRGISGRNAYSLQVGARDGFVCSCIL